MRLLIFILEPILGELSALTDKKYTDNKLYGCANCIG